MNQQPGRTIYENKLARDAHEEFRALLPSFAMVCFEGSDSDLEWNALELHLDGCPLCREELADLLQLLDDTAIGILATAPEIPVPDIAYLPPWVTPEEPHGLVAVVHTIKGFVPQVLIRFTEMLTIAMRQPAPAGEFRSSFPADGDPSEPTTPIDLPEEYTYQLHGPSLDNVVVAVDFNLAHREHHLYRVKITVIDQEQDPFSQDGHRVQISYEVNTSEQITDSSGCVSFTNIPYSALSELQITINIRSTG